MKITGRNILIIVMMALLGFYVTTALVKNYGD